MKGLFIKDFKLLKNQSMFLAVIFLISIVFLVVWKSPFFVMGYATSLVSIFTVITISYDEYDNGMAYLFTLPVSRKMYVLEKYLFGVLITLSALVGISILAFGAAEIRNYEYSVQEGVGTMAASILIVMLIVALMIPLHLKFEADKSRVALLLTIGVIFLIAFAVFKISQIAGIDIEAVIDGIFSASIVKLLAGVVIICVILMVISCLVSLRIMEKKEL